jgi:hypothetical protein
MMGKNEMNEDDVMISEEFQWANDMHEGIEPEKQWPNLPSASAQVPRSSWSLLLPACANRKVSSIRHPES